MIVIGREFLVSGLRSIAASEGFTVEASELGKFKMVVQIVSVVAVILDHRWKEWPIYGHYFFRSTGLLSAAIWFMVCVSLVSAIDYFVAFWSKIDQRVVKRRRRAFILSRRRKPVVPRRPTVMSLLRPSPLLWSLAEFSLARIFTGRAHAAAWSGPRSDSLDARKSRDSHWIHPPASCRTSRRIHIAVFAWRVAGMCRLRSSRQPCVSRGRRHSPRRRLRRYAILSRDAARSSRT